MTAKRKGDGSQLVINELLMYMFHHMKRHLSDSIKEVDDIMRSSKTLDAIFADTALSYVFVAVNMDQVPDVKHVGKQRHSLSLIE